MAPEKLSRIFAMRAQKKTLAEIGRVFGISRQRAHQVLRRRRGELDPVLYRFDCRLEEIRAEIDRLKEEERITEHARKVLLRSSM